MREFIKTADRGPDSNTTRGGKVMNVTYKQMITDWVGWGLFAALATATIVCGLYFWWVTR